MRRCLTAFAFACMVAFAATAFAGPIADSIAFQGRLTDASDVAVPDGNRDLIISIWTDSIGGTMLHSEVVVITTSKGLYSTCIGCASSTISDIFTGQPLFLQTQLAGQAAMSPRTRLRSVPSSVTSSSLHGQSPVPGGGIVSAAVSSVTALAGGGGGAAAASYARLGADTDGDGHDDFFVADSALTNGVHSVAGGDVDGDGVSDVSIASSIRPTSASLAIKTKGTSAQRLSAGGDCDDTDASLHADCDDDNDGVVDREAAMRITPSTSSLAIKTKGTSAQRLSAGGDCDDTDASLYTDCDDDNDGLSETSVSTGSNTEGSTLKLTGINQNGMPNRISMNMTVARQTQTGTFRIGQDSNNDGDDDCDGVFTVTPTTSSVAINTKGTGADKGRVISSTSPDSVVTEQTYEFSNSLLMPALMKAKEKANRTKCSSNLRYQSPVAINDGEMAVDSAGVGLSMTTDSDGDGIPEASVKVGSGASLLGGALPGGAVLSSRCDIDDDGDAEGTFESSVIPGTCSVAIKTRGTGADKNRTAGSSANDSSAVNYLDIDDDGDGISEAHAVSSVSSLAGGGGGGAAAASYAATGRWYTDSDDDGVSEGDIEAIATPGTCSVAIKTRGTGADKNRVINQTDDSSSVVIASTDSASITMRVKNKGVVKGNVNVISAGALRVSLDTDGNGYFESGVGVGVAPSHPFETAGGAYCDGTTWVNASDANVKENFQPVDGAELLDKISDLEITKWNYKGDTETEHIGPTAQDFQKTFGVGSDGKSISTIDPSGIALAAIKQLTKENAELKKQVDELSILKSEVEQLKKLLTEKK